MKKVAIVGTKGVPARYGGFETLVENLIGENCSPDIQYTIFCSGKDLDEKNRPTVYKGALLKYIPLHANGVQSVPYDIWSLIKVIRGYDVILVLGVSGCSSFPIFRLFCHKRLIVNIDGLEHRRAKWGRAARWVLRFSESMAVRCSDMVIADNKGIQDYVCDTYRKEAVLIAYGGDHVLRNVSNELQYKYLAGHGLKPGEYAITICRIEPENNCHITLESFTKINRRLVFVGNWKYSEYGRSLKEKYGQYPNILLLDSIYDLDMLYALRANAGLYIHGHSAGGTNPSLVEAMFFGRPVIAYNVIYNRATTEDKALYFLNEGELQNLLSNQHISFEQNAASMCDIANRRYRWNIIARQYEALY